MNPDVCIYCGATGCVQGDAEHTLACPFTTGMWPTDQGMVDRATVCAACDQPFALNDLYAEVNQPDHDMARTVQGSYGGIETVFIVCIPCAALAAEVAQ